MVTIITKAEEKGYVQEEQLNILVMNHSECYSC